MSQHSFVTSSVNLLYTSFLLTSLLTVNTHARIGYFWHITDLHLDTIYSTQGDVLRSCWRMERQQPGSSPRSPGRFGDYLCDSPWSLIESAAKAMKSRQGDNVEFVLWTGDGLSHSAHGMFESKKLEILRNITDLLGRTFSSQFVFPVLGHEDGTTTNFRHMGELWRHWLPSEALQTFEKGGYYSIEQTKSRLRIIALNTNFMRHDPKYSQSQLAAVRQRQSNGGLGGGIYGNHGGDASEYKNFYYHHGNVHQHHGHSNSDWPASSSYGSYSGSHHRGIGTIPGVLQDGSGARVSALSEFENQDTEKQWNWLEEVLSKSKSNKETVYIVGHIPPGLDERHIGMQHSSHDIFTESNNKRYLELVRKYSSIIQGQFFGHLHSDSFRIIYDEKGNPVSWIMISPSVTPRKTSIGSNNPAMRLYKFDTDSGQVLDYTQYYLDLQLANQQGEPNWQPEYNLTHYYGLNDISAISLHNFVDRFTGNDGSWFTKYYRANTVRYFSDTEKECEGVCLLHHYCAITRVDYKEFRQCLETERSHLNFGGAAAIAKPSLVLSTTCPLLALLFTLVATCCRSTMMLLPKMLRQQLSKHNNNTKGRKTALITKLMLWLLQNISNRQKSATSIEINANKKPKFVTAACNDICLQRSMTLQIVASDSNCRHNNVNNIGVRLSSDDCSNSSCNSSLIQATCCCIIDKPLNYYCNACRKCNLQHYSHIHFFQTFNYRIFFCQIFVAFTLAVVSKLLKCMQYVALVCSKIGTATFRRHHVAAIRQAKHLH